MEEHKALAAKVVGDPIAIVSNRAKSTAWRAIFHVEECLIDRSVAVITKVKLTMTAVEESKTM
jgi:hypothetical protein